MDIQGNQGTVDRNSIPTPSVLYKYHAFNKWTQDIFERDEVYFQSPDGFNDPFDSKTPLTYVGSEEQRVIRLKDLWRQGPARGEKEEDLHAQALDIVRRGSDVPLVLSTLARSAERTRRRLGVFCMTSKRNDIVMWSHYADAHKGFCLGFKTANPFFGRANPVNYERDRPCLNLIMPLDPNDIDIADNLFAKSEEWQYEDEWRIVDHEKGPGIHQYPAEALCEVILGCRITPKNRHQIMQWYRARDLQPNIFWAEEKDREFGLDTISIS